MGDACCPWRSRASRPDAAIFSFVRAAPCVLVHFESRVAAQKDFASRNFWSPNGSCGHCV
jgi:hypothetical protein